VKGSLGVFALIGAGFAILLIIGLPGLVIHHLNNARARRQVQSKLDEK